VPFTQWMRNANPKFAPAARHRALPPGAVTAAPQVLAKRQLGGDQVPRHGTGVEVSQALALESGI
jgi:hypothetical protein